MKKVALFLLVVLATTATPRVLSAHHSFAAEYDAGKPIELKGVVTRLEWTNPHSWLHLDVSDGSGQVTKWAIEFGSPFSLMQRGMRKTDFPIGVEVTVKGSRAKSGKNVANASSVTLPDGKGFYTGAADAGDASKD